MIFELATSQNKIIGWRLTLGNQKFLIWRDQEGMPGIRSGDAFVPGIEETIKYEIIYTSAL